MLNIINVKVELNVCFKGGMWLEEIIKIFESIQKTRSLNDKKTIIVANRDNELLKKCLRFLLDNNIVTGISTKKLSKKIKVNTLNGINKFEECMEYLTKNNTGTDHDIAMVQRFIDSQPEETRDFYRKMVTKKFKLGADVKLVNKCIPELIPTWDIQQAYPLSDKNKPRDGEWFALSQKLNGNNNGVIDSKNISRQGKEFTGLNHITSDINKLSFKNMFFNGELIRKNKDNLPDDENFQIGTGIINSDETDKSCIKFVIYEMFPKEEFLKGESKLTYKQRRKTYLEPLSKEINELGLENIEVVPLVYEGTDQSKIQELLDKADANGWEGLMLNKDTKWKNKRNNGILKVKSFKHADILCTDVIEGDGKYKGTLGLIKCDYKGNELGVGSGFTDEQRNYFWNNKENIIGKIVQIKYKTETKNKQGGLSVQFPIFQTIRIDKTEPSYS